MHRDVRKSADDDPSQSLCNGGFEVSGFHLTCDFERHS